MIKEDELSTQDIIRKYVQFTGLCNEGFAMRYNITLRTLENWMTESSSHRKPSDFVLYSLKRFMKIDYGFKEEYLYYSDTDWEKLLNSNGIYYIGHKKWKKAKD